MKKKTHLLHFYQPVQYGHSVYTFVSDSSILNANIGVKQFFFQNRCRLQATRFTIVQSSEIESRKTMFRLSNVFLFFSRRIKRTKALS